MLARCFIAFLFAAGLAWQAAAQPGPVLREARALFAEGDYPAAITRLGPDDSTATLSAEGFRLLGLSYQALQRHERAVDALLRSDTTDLRVAAALGRSYDRLGDPEPARRFYEAAYRQDSTNQGVATGLARLYGDARRWADVAGIYTLLLEQDAENSYLHLQLGTAYRMLDSTDLAIVHLERAHRLNPRNVRAVLSLSAVYFEVEHLISARRVLDRSLEEQPRSEALWQRRGEVALQEEQYEKAIESFRNAALYGDSTALNLRNLGVSLYLDRQYDEAHDLLERSYQADSSDGMGTFYLGMAELEREAFDAALYYFDRATELMGVTMIAEVASQKATTYDRMERDGDAIRTYRLALGLDPARREILFHLGALYDAYYADKSTALEQYELFLSQVEADELAQQQAYARQRIREIKERRFFDQKATVPETTPDSLGAQADTSGLNR